MPVLERRIIPEGRKFRTEASEKRRNVFAVSKSVVDSTIPVLPEERLPKDIRTAVIGDKVPISNADFEKIKDELRDRGVTFESTVGGNSVNAAHRIKEFRRGNEAAGPVVVRTWVGSDGFRKLMDLDLTHPGMQPDIISYEGATPQGLVIPRRTEHGIDRTIFSNKPEGLPSEFVGGIPKNTEYAIINSLSGDQWDMNLAEGVRVLKAQGVEYAYTPGSSQLKAIKENDIAKMNAVYEAIGGAKTLNVDMSELQTLLKGKDILPSEDITELLDQGLSLGAEAIFVTNGAEGSFGATAERKLWVGSVKVDQVKSTVGAGDAYMAAAVHKYFETGDLHESMRWGSASGSFAVETIGAHENPPTQDQLEDRLQERAPQAFELQNAA